MCPVIYPPRSCWPAPVTLLRRLRSIGQAPQYSPRGGCVLLLAGPRIIPRVGDLGELGEPHWPVLITLPARVRSIGRSPEYSPRGGCVALAGLGTIARVGGLGLGLVGVMGLGPHWPVPGTGMCQFPLASNKPWNLPRGDGKLHEACRLEEGGGGRKKGVSEAAVLSFSLSRAGQLASALPKSWHSCRLNKIN